MPCRISDLESLPKFDWHSFEQSVGLAASFDRKYEESKRFSGTIVSPINPGTIRRQMTLALEVREYPFLGYLFVVSGNAYLLRMVTARNGRPEKHNGYP
jgi:hypothetical protein